MRNYTSLIGRLTKDPVMQGNEENPVCKFTLAVQRGYTKQGEQDNCDFIPIKAFKGKNLANTCYNHFKKGMQVGIVARLQSSNYTENNQRKFSLDVVAEDILFLEPKNSSSSNSSNSYSNNNNNYNNDIPNEDPFENANHYSGKNPWVSY